MSDTGGKGDYQAWSTTRGKERGVPSDTSMQSFGAENISEVILRRSLFVGMDKLKQRTSDQVFGLIDEVGGQDRVEIDEA
jgi:hypothetical protein